MVDLMPSRSASLCILSIAWRLYPGEGFVVACRNDIRVPDIRMRCPAACNDDR
jgi:hypothetical protein